MSLMGLQLLARLIHTYVVLKILSMIWGFEVGIWSEREREKEGERERE